MGDTKIVSEPILFISDVHCQYELINAQITHAESLTGTPVSDVIVLGDFGFFEPVLRKYFRRDKHVFQRPTRFIEGNHEDYHDLAVYADAYADCLIHLPRGTVTAIGGYRFLCLGGTAYMDAMMTPEAAEIHDMDIDRCLQRDALSIDIIITHDCPSGIGVPNTPGFEMYGEPGFPRSRELSDRFHPVFWVFGHHHKWFDTEQDGTRYLGLPESWNGYGLLYPGFEWRSVSHPIGKPLGFWEKFRKLFLGEQKL
ncbi:metallophosphoesterase [bacterium]|nr:metallophosphoesterase [candidate division CSSED10-310 bacterium]